MTQRYRPRAPTSDPDNNVTKLKPATNAERQRRFKARRKAEKEAAGAATPAPLLSPVTSLVTPPVTPGNHALSTITMLAAVALASVEGYFGVVGMTAIFASAPVPVTVMTIVLEAAKLVTVAWLARYWYVAPLALRFSLISIVALLMVLTGFGTYGYFSRAHLAHQTEMQQSIDHDAEPVSQAVALAEANQRDLDGRIRQLDDMVRDATSRGRTKIAMGLVDDQAKMRADLVAMRAVTAVKLAGLRVQMADVEGRRGAAAAEIGPASYVATLLGMADGESAVRLIILLLVLVLDPAAILLTVAATYRVRTRYVSA
jgi:hypothetical protein